MSKDPKFNISKLMVHTGRVSDPGVLVGFGFKNMVGFSPDPV